MSKTKRSIFEVGHDVVAIARRNKIDIDAAADPATIIENIRDVIHERGKTFRDDLRMLNKLRREIGGDDEDDAAAVTGVDGGNTIINGNMDV